MKKIIFYIFLIISLLLISCNDASRDNFFIVTYNGNGNTSGTVPVDYTNYEQGATVSVLDNSGNLVKSGHTFSGWNTQSDGNGESYTSGQSFIIGSANVILYAKWTVIYTVTYDANGNTAGTVPVDYTNYEQGATVSVLDNTGYLLKVNVSGVSYKFAGWIDGNGVVYSQSQTFVMGNSNVMLYAIWLPYTLRDIGPAGGLIFYDKWSYSNGWRYLEAAPIDQSSNSAFSNVTYALANTSFDIGTGALNTINIINQIGHTTSAAKICADYTIINGVIYDDWFLPSRFELAVMLQNLAYGLDGYGNPLIPVGNFAVDSSYWSSSDYYGDLAWFQNGGVVSSTYKTTKMNVRAVRSF